ncbi:type II toxin-antitoxin system HicB family antitoxin [Paraburkholderia sp. RL18-103-BIB-C]|uniref:type II toxin-antitoxin system HicB family antitoxin n=1 Tax=Paraburkholderia sp. RL18-103-BIB-C TaxID=3031637 RepID=UPI0038BA3C18
MAVVPLYMWCEGNELRGQSPLVPGVTFHGKTAREFQEDVRANWVNFTALAVDNPAPTIEKYETTYEALGLDGWWSVVRITPAVGIEAGARAERVNISMQAQLVKQIDRAARDVGLTRSAFFAAAAREKLQRGL